MADDRLETVAITYNQPETLVLRSMLHFYGIPNLAIGAAHAAVNPVLMVALGGIHVRVPHDAVDEARALLREVASRPQAVRPYLIDNRWLNAAVVIAFCALLGLPVPPTRTGSTFLLGE
ncbi:hypothetical protein [Sphingomonas endolithica]|uniref:hypothetical protein n=1 Tax=Sphingomonas endolithica TaxID=2972485 RepID=UPI0021AECA3E|nr:hypothetical protein [Sphingomonas sp. ZFBP2030]